MARLTIAELVAAFEKVAAERVKPETLTAYRCVLKPFVAVFGTREPAELTPPQVEQWANKGKWSSATRRYALRVVGTAYSWAERSGRVSPNSALLLRGGPDPLTGYDHPDPHADRPV